MSAFGIKRTTLGERAGLPKTSSEVDNDGPTAARFLRNFHRACVGGVFGGVAGLTKAQYAGAGASAARTTLNRETDAHATLRRSTIGLSRNAYVRLRRAGR